jgi:EAL domain-containing protein (putative c-di-GMP-specific phosphodiesterase class I)
LNTLLDRILAPDGIRMLFQPIVKVHSWGWQLHSLESLARGPKGTLFESASLLFDYVQRKKAERMVDRVCIANAFREFGGAPLNTGISVNVHASTLGHDPEFAEFLCGAAREHKIPSSRITVEIVEHTPAWHVPGFLAALKQLRASGVCIALDDVGIGYSNYRMMLDVHPDYFKVDSYVVSGAHADANRRAILASVVKLARDFGSAVVCEGIETVADLRVLLDLGIELMQGYLFSPAVTLSDISGTYLWTDEFRRGQQVLARPIQAICDVH